MHHLLRKMSNKNENKNNLYQILFCSNKIQFKFQDPSEEERGKESSSNINIQFIPSIQGSSPNVQARPFEITSGTLDSVGRHSLT